jgi:hypothetical protein
MQFRRLRFATAACAYVSLLLSLTGQAGEQSAAPAKWLQGKRVMVLGDSITQNGLYVSFIEIMTLRQEGLWTIDLHTEMKGCLAQRRGHDRTFLLSGDGIHPGELGHLLMACTFIKGIGLSAPSGDLETELSRIKADPLFARVKKHREIRSAAWLPYSQGRASREKVDDAEQAAASLASQISEMRHGP